MPSVPRSSRTRWLRRLVPLGLLLLGFVLWNGWAERYPERERELRVGLQEQLETRFPDAMRPPADRYGWLPGAAGQGRERRLRVGLVHGLDEPGGIWADLLPELARAGFEAWEFRYPNDQGIDRSTDLLAERWAELPADRPVALIGHSMGGLVIRDFVTRWRHPVDAPPAVGGARVRGAVLVGTPNQGSGWSRLRILLEPRDQLLAGRETGFTPLAGLQDGTGAAKIDLQPGSRFLAELNVRHWPASVDLRVIGGLAVPLAPAFGDGVVTLESLAAPGAPAPVVLVASHRGLVVRVLGAGDEPPAIPVILALLEALDSAE